ncbi:MAG: radical SAM protein, partial [Candidatus Thermoplasmatota archaeon]|nr:radical SAM protein [Candidatus Thermoplasmatota archaeon]
MDPEYAAALTLMVDEGAQIESEVMSGKLTLLGPDEVLKELKDIVVGLELTDCLFRANHASNYHPIGGRFPADKAKIIAQIERALSGSEFKPEYFRRL